MASEKTIDMEFPCAPSDIGELDYANLAVYLADNPDETVQLTCVLPHSDKVVHLAWPRAPQNKGPLIHPEMAELMIRHIQLTLRKYRASARVSMLPVDEAAGPPYRLVFHLKLAPSHG